MKMTIEPTPEMADLTIDGRPIKSRVWSGQTEKGLPIEAYVLSIVPMNPTQAKVELLRNELPDFMRPSRETYEIGTGGMMCGNCGKAMIRFDADAMTSQQDVKDRAMMIHRTGCESGWICRRCDQWVPT